MKISSAFSIILYIVKKAKISHSLQSVVGGNIRLLRGSMGLTIEKLAEKADLSAAYLAAIERGEKWPRPESVEHIARGLNCSPYDLFKPENRIPRDISKYVKELISDITVAVNKFIKKLNSSVNNTEKS